MSRSVERRAASTAGVVMVVLSVAGGEWRGEVPVRGGLLCNSAARCRFEAWTG